MTHISIRLDWPSETDTQKLICRETEKFTTNPRPRMKSSRQGASTDVVIQASSLFFGEPCQNSNTEVSGVSDRGVTALF